MEALEAISEGAWNSLGGMYISDEADFMSELIGTCTFPPGVERGAVDEVQPGSWPSYRSSLNVPITSVSASFPSQISSGPYLSSNESGTDVLFSGTLAQENYYLDDPSPVLARNSCSVPMDYCSSLCPSEWIMESSESPKETTCQETHSQLELQNSHEVEFSPLGDEVLSSGILGKRSQSSKDLHKRMRTGRSEVASKLDFSNNNKEEANAARPRRPSSSPCDSHDDSNGGATCSSLSPKGSALCNNNLTSSPNSKARASRGSATEPQSLYARKRREKINARLRILQSLIPNGTKVDISTMLEEAVHYVKFLQLQIKMLSSDELWMYAPIAYNGMDVGLNKIARGRQF